MKGNFAVNYYFVLKDDCVTSTGPVNGTWSQWSQFTLCSKTCGGGVRTRTRSCNNPPSLRGGLPCVGLPVDCEDCNENACPGMPFGCEKISSLLTDVFMFN